MYRDPKEFRDRFNRWKCGKPVYQAGRPLPAYEDDGDFEEFRKTLPQFTTGSDSINMGPKKQLSLLDIESTKRKLHPEPGLSGYDPIGGAFVTYMGGRALSSAIAIWNNIRALKQMKETYKWARKNNELTRGATRAWKILDADKTARDVRISGGDNPVAWLYDMFGRPIVNAYDRLNQNPIIGPLIP